MRSMNRTLLTYVPPRRRDAIVRPVDDEFLIIDKETNRAHCLNQTAATVWQLCDGKNTVTEMAAMLGKNSSGPGDPDVVWVALKQLGKAGLLTSRVSLPDTPAGLNRRDAIRKIAIASAIALPLVTSIAIPAAAQAASCVHNGKPCILNPQCCTGICRSGRCTT
jgi:Coenzyme PQQ synthesis protein D (PqqD)